MDNIQLTTECLKSINHIGGATYQNVCNGAISYVPWGAGDWVMNGFMLLPMALLAVFVFFFIRDIR